MQTFGVRSQGELDKMGWPWSYRLRIIGSQIAGNFPHAVDKHRRYRPGDEVQGGPAEEDGASSP